MSAFPKKDTLYSEAEARICLNCTLKRCRGDCDRLRQEKRRLKAERKTQDISKPLKEFSIPDQAPWEKKKPYLDKIKEE